MIAKHRQHEQGQGLNLFLLSDCEQLYFFKANSQDKNI
jgi:hypothetical protein